MRSNAHKIILLAFNINAIGDIDTGSYVSDENIIARIPWNSVVHDPPVFTVISFKAIVDLEFMLVFVRVIKCIEKSFPVLMMNAFVPTLTQFIFHGISCKEHPGFVEEI